MSKMLDDYASVTTSARPLPQLSRRATSGSSSAIRDLLAQAKRPGMVSLAGGLPDPSAFPVAQLAATVESCMASNGQQVLQYGSTKGGPDARAALARLFAARTDSEQIVITTGSQQALDLIARVMLDPGDAVVVGDPDYLGALQVFRSYQADLCPMAVDEHGLDTGQLETRLQHGLRPKVAYVVPHFHNPTGTAMAPERRAHLAELSQQYGFLVIEDDPYRELHYGETVLSESLGDPALTCELRSTSKTLAPGLRVGALHGPSWLTSAVETAKQSSDLHTSTLSQAIVANALPSDWYKRHLSTLRQAYGAKRNVLVAAVREVFGDAAEFSEPAGGMFLWVRFDGVDTSAWLQRCLERNVCFVPGVAFAVHQDLADYARLSFATGSPSELRQACVRMEAALEHGVCTPQGSAH